MATLLFKTYFKVSSLSYFALPLLTPFAIQLKSTALCININKGIKANELLDLSYYPLSHQVRPHYTPRNRADDQRAQITYRYYMGVFAFLREDYAIAETELTFCLHSIRKRSQRQIEYVSCLLHSFCVLTPPPD